MASIPKNPLLAAGIAALVACAPRYHHAEPLAPDQLWTPRPMQLVDLGDVRVNTLDTGGSGPPVVLIHGLSSYTAFWEHQVEHLARTHRVLALDLPGYGGSDRPDAPYTPPWFADVVHRWMTELGVPHATVVGHSMGGQVALTLAIEHPEAVDALILSAPAGFERFTPGEGTLIKGYWHEERALESSEQEIRASFVAAVFNRHDDGVERLIEERVRLARHPSFAGTSVAVSRSIAGMLDFPVRDRLGAIRAPTLIVYGSDDKMIPNPLLHGGTTRAVASFGRDAIPGARLEIVPGAGHTVHHDAPEAFNAAVDGFLATLPRAAAVEVSPPPPAPAPVAEPAPAPTEPAAIWGER